MERLWFSVTDEFGLWPRIEAEFRARLPLRNLIWKGGIAQTAQFVAQLSADVRVNEEAEPDPTGVVLPGQDTGALLHIYLCEVSESESDTRKAEVRARAKAWAARAGQHRGASWLVVVVAGGSDAQRLSAGPKFLNMRATVFDRLRSEVGGKRDGVVLLRPDAVESWNAAVLALRDRAVQALEARAASLGDEIRRLDANRMLPGWNYCRFFVVKEQLAALFRALALHDAALAQYDELEAAFLQLLDARALSWFSSFGGGGAGDDFADILDVQRKPYRRQIADNAISMFDFRMYLFGQQAQLLLDAARFEELAARAQHFVATLGAAMRERGSGLAPAFVAAWTYSVCTNVVEICEGVPVQARALAAAKAEFLTSARQQLDVLGALSGRLPPDCVRATLAISSVRAVSSALAAAEPAPAPMRVANPVLAEALAADARFDQVYVRTCDQATQYYGDCGRRRFAQALQADVARLHMSRGRWADAARILRPLVPPGAPDLRACAQLAQCEQRLGRTAASLDLVLRLVAAPQPDAASAAAHARLLAELARDVEPCARAPPPQLLRVDDAWVEDSDATCALRVRVHAGVALAAARVEAVLVAGHDGRRLELVLGADGVVLAAGATDVRLTSDAVSCPGRVEVRAVNVRVGNVEFQVAASNANARRRVRLHPHPVAPHVALDASGETLDVVVTTRGAAVDAGMRIWLHGADAQPLLGAEIPAGSGFAVEGGALTVGCALPPHACVRARLPLPPAPVPGDVQVLAEYTSGGEARLLADSAAVDFARPLRVTASVRQNAVLIRAQNRALAPVRVHALLVDGRDAGDAWLAQRGFLQFGESLTLVCEDAGAAKCVELRFSSLLDAVRELVGAQVELLAAAHGLVAHRRYLQRLALAHVRRTLDARQTLRAARVCCEPLSPLYLLAAQDCAQPVRRALRRLFAELDARLAAAELDAGAARQQRMRVPVLAGRQPGLVTVFVETGRQLCAYESAALHVRIEGGNAPRRLRVTLAAASCMVAGPATQEVVVRGSCRLRFAVVPLAAGHLPLPEIICHEADTGADPQWARLPVCLRARPSALCVLRDRAMPVCSVPVDVVTPGIIS
ncbi:hypothetical protein H4S02_001114 [Coemansia sp. RSA 2611]|nr:hypothetical protein H4S02_001114 [Coemansia sp. RSA 2611]